MYRLKAKYNFPVNAIKGKGYQMIYGGTVIEFSDADYEAEVSKGVHKTTKKPLSAYINHMEVIERPEPKVEPKVDESEHEKRGPGRPKG